MSIRYKLLIAFSVIVLLATAVAIYGMHVVSNSSTLVVRLYDGPMIAAMRGRRRCNSPRHAAPWSAA
jgi:methyl-accepting chemotaxis protein